MLYVCQWRRGVCKPGGKSAKVIQKIYKMYQIKKELVTKKKKWDNTTPPMYTNDHGSDLKYSILYVN